MLLLSYKPTPQTSFGEIAPIPDNPLFVELGLGLETVCQRKSHIGVGVATCLLAFLDKLSSGSLNHDAGLVPVGRDISSARLECKPHISMSATSPTHIAKATNSTTINIITPTFRSMPMLRHVRPRNLP